MWVPFLRLVVIGLAVLVPGGSALGLAEVNLVSVSVDPPMPASNQPVSLLALLECNYTPIVLLQPTPVSRQGNLWDVHLYASSPGMLPALSSRVETISLGILDPGLYTYTVTQHVSRIPDPWLDQTRSGSFYVQTPEPATLMLFALGGALALRTRWPGWRSRP